MSTTTPPRPPLPTPSAPARSLTEGLRVPEIVDVRMPRVLERVPRWLLGGGALVILLLASYIVRTREISGTLWFQEAGAIGTATQSLGGVLHATHVGGAAPLYYLLLHFWISAAGDSVGATRDLSLVLGLACIPVGAWAGRSLSGPRGAFYGAVFFAFNSLLTEYAQQVGPYALLILLGIVATTAFLQGFVHRRRRYLWLFVAATEAALYTQGSTGLYLFGLVCALVVIAGCAPVDARRGIARDAARCGLGLLVLYLPWLPSTIVQIAHDTFPWHYAPVITPYLPSDLDGGQRVSADLLVLGVMAVAPFVIARGRRREPEAVVLYALLVIVFAAILLGFVANVATPLLIARYYAMAASALMLFGALAAARTKIVGLIAAIVFVICCADPAAFASSHPSNMNEVAAQLGGRLHRGDLVLMAQPEQAPLAWYYLDSGLRWSSTLGPMSDPRYTNWDGALGRLQRTAPGPTLANLVASLSAGQQLLYIRPLTEGAKDWKSPWASLVQARAAQWGQLLSADVASGTLTQEAVAPENYPGDCCVASSAVLYRKS